MFVENSIHGNLGREKTKEICWGHLVRYILCHDTRMGFQKEE